MALYGAGRHTQWLLENALTPEDARAIAVILDDEPRERPPIAGIRISHPSREDPSGFGVVVVSSESIESMLQQRAIAWARQAPDASRPRVMCIYERLPRGPYNASHDDMFARLADAPASELSEMDAGEFSVVHRIPAAPPRAPGQPLPVPPEGMRAGYNGPNYLESGKRAATAILEAVRRHHSGLSPRDILDWGSSSGRVLRHFPDVVPGSRCWGCDIDAWTINWAAANLVPPLKFFRSTTTPALPFASASFDLIYAISVFTHLSDNFDTWLLELRRLLRPGGFLFVTINDEHVWERLAAEPTSAAALRCPRLDFSIPLTDDFVTHGLGPHAQSFWHTSGIRRRWSFAFDVLEITPRLIDRGQTGVVLRKTAGAGEA
jgi:SAM-dependent methyltransferase